MAEETAARADVGVEGGTFAGTSQPPGTQSAPLRAAQVLRLQRIHGNQAVQRVIEIRRRRAADALSSDPAAVTAPMPVQRNPVAAPPSRGAAARDEYVSGTQRFRVGDAAAGRVLMDIVGPDASVRFRVFNFETGQSQELTVREWRLYRAASVLGPNDGITRLGRRLTPQQWRSLWPNPLPEILRRFESGALKLDDEAVLTGYRGMVRSEGRSSLDANERSIDELLEASDRVQRIQEYAEGLREAGVIRDTLQRKESELERRLVAQHSFTFGPPKAGTGPSTFHRMNIHRELGTVRSALEFWLHSFPLLTRLSTHHINPASVEGTLRRIKANIVRVRRDLNKGSLDPMEMQPVRARLAAQLGPRAAAVVAAEDRSRNRWSIAKAIALTAAGIALLFLPGGIFIDAAIGVAIAGQSIADAILTGRAANTGLHVDDGLVSQAQARGAGFAAVLSVVLAVVGASAASFRVLRFGRVLHNLKRSMPQLALRQRAALARAISHDPRLMAMFSRLTPDDQFVVLRLERALRETAGDARALRGAVSDVAQLAAIPRRTSPSADLYEPLRAITDGSDVTRIARHTGISEADVALAKKHLMLDEHILVDNGGALFRGRFEAFEDFAAVWGKAARSERLSRADRALLQRIVRHEAYEGAQMASNALTLEQAFLRGELEAHLRTFLQSKGWKKAAIDATLALENKPITPYRYAHFVTVLNGFPNP